MWGTDPLKEGIGPIFQAEKEWAPGRLKATDKREHKGEPRGA